MATIQLLEPEHESCTEELQAFRWGETSETTPDADRWDDLTVRADDRSIPKSVAFAWEAIPSRSPSPVYDLLISTDSEFTDRRLVTDIPEPRRDVDNLRIGTRYFWKVVARDRTAVVATSPVRSFTTHPSTPRWLHVPGITNVRDLGGWPLPGNRCIRQGLAYRSSEMNSHVDITDEGKRVLIDDLEIRTDLDLRGNTEERKAVLDPSTVKWINVPISPYGSIVADECRELYRRIFEVFSDPANYPILFHCWGGCDRAGTVAFLLNALLGLDRESLIRDYESSSLTIWGTRSHLSDEFQSLLSALRPFGGPRDDVGEQAENYLGSIGVTAEGISSIRTLLIAATGDG